MPFGAILPLAAVQQHKAIERRAYGMGSGVGGEDFAAGLGFEAGVFVSAAGGVTEGVAALFLSSSRPVSGSGDKTGAMAESRADEGAVEDALSEAGEDGTDDSGFFAGAGVTNFAAFFFFALDFLVL